MDFFWVSSNNVKKNEWEVTPEFATRKTSDLMIRGKKFYAVWDSEKGMWSQNEFDLIRMVDTAVNKEKERILKEHPDYVVHAKTLVNFSSNAWIKFLNYVKSMPDNYVMLDSKLAFANTEPGKKTDYISRRLPYELKDGDYSVWDTLMEKLYAPKEREKIEWAIGSVVSGDARKIQKFIVLYGEGGKGKGTIISIIEKLFEGYTTTFNAKSLTSNNNQFAAEVFAKNPLVAIDGDARLDKIEDNTQLNGLVAHESMTINAKFQSPYTARVNCMLFLGTNHPVKITDAKSGIIRRLIDVEPTGNTFDGETYDLLMDRVGLQLGAIAKHCLDVYTKLGKHYYDSYRSLKMMLKTDVFFNFVEENYFVFKEQDGISLKQAYAMYKEYCDETGAQGSVMPMFKFREELKNYFKNFEPITRVDGKQVRSWFSGFKHEKIDDGGEPEKAKADQEKAKACWLTLDQTESLFDELLKDCPAQYARDDTEGPYVSWVNAKKTLKDLDTKRTHYVNIPESMGIISVDFDLTDETGKKSAEKNIEAASKWTPTYAEYSKGGSGIHLEYYYDGDQSKLKSVYSPGIEIKATTGGNSLRRRLSLCNNLPLAHISSGLPLKEEKVVDFETIKDDKMLLNMIKKNLRKEILPSTRQSIDLIAKDLEEFYKSGRHFDVREMKKKVMLFAANSSHQADYCLKKVNKMIFHSDDVEDPKEEDDGVVADEDKIAFFDVEVFPNLFLINWKFAGEPKCHRMINPKPQDLEEFIHLKLVGFNCRRYDNHIVYARYLGKSNLELYELSQRIVGGSPDAFFGKAYDLSYTDVYDFCSKKQSLKKWEIELGIHHQELGLPWDEPVDESLWMKVAEYCDNDVFATEAVFNKRQEDWRARKILARLAGLNPNATTNQLTQKIIFGWEKKPQATFNYRFMGEMNGTETYSLPMDEDPEYTVFKDGKPYFPGYTFDHGKSIYRGEEVGEGGYVYAEPGMYWNVALLDIASMHPSSIVAEELFGPEYTARFKDILDARILIKHREWEKARQILDGKLAPFLEGFEKLSEEKQKEEADNLSTALKIAINSVYGLTSAKFDNPFRDKRNKDNIVAKRGALFMVNLKHLVQKKGFTVAHIKTDSIKIPNATPEIIQFVMDYGKLYGYNFELESVYDRMCLVNNAVYVAHVQSGKHAGEWNTTGAQFAEPYVKKTLFTREPIEFKDLCQTKTVTTNMYLDMNEELPDVSMSERDLDRMLKRTGELLKAIGYDGSYDQWIAEPQKDLSGKYSISEEDALKCIAELEDLKEDYRILQEEIAKGHHYVFVGKAGAFCPILPGRGGGWLMRKNGNKYDAVVGTKDQRWLESETVGNLKMEDAIDRRYFDRLVDDAIRDISQYGDIEVFRNLDVEEEKVE